jgi:murein DD-endopeptidase MepM/ murein hydrolase activator NlpD
VTTVADGEVTTIWWLPGYGNLVIVDHYSGFRTVYAHLSEITVSEGQKVKEGEQIGASGEALEGARLHFELWKDREKQNPELWLSRP